MKFTMRDLLLVTMIVALVLGWWVDHRYHRIQLKESEAWRHRAAALADHLLNREKLEVVWRDVDIFVRRQDGMGSTLISAPERYEPSPVWSWPELPARQPPAPNPPKE